MKYLLVSFLILFVVSGTAVADADQQMSIDNDKNKIMKMVTKAQRKMHANCKTKLKVNVDFSAFDSLKIDLQVIQFERFKRKSRPR